MRRRIQGMPMTQEFISFMKIWSKDKPLKAGEELFAFTGKLIIGKLSDPINLSGSGFRFNSEKFIGNYQS